VKTKKIIERTTEMMENFNTFKQMFVRAPCRATPDPFIITIDF